MIPNSNLLLSMSKIQNIIINADVMHVINHIDNDSVHLTFTSPPYYNARNYSIYPDYVTYIDFLRTVFREVHRITKEGRFLVLNTSPVITPRLNRAHSSTRHPIPFDIHYHLINMGWEFIDDIIWVKPEASVKARNNSFRKHRKPLAYKPNVITEYIVVYRKSTNKLIDWNIKQYDNTIIEQSIIPDGYETTNVWNIKPRSNKKHPAVFPFELCEKIIRYYSYVGDTVFDPFAGSGTVGIVAKNLNRNFLLTEKNTSFASNAKEILQCKLFTLEEFIKEKHQKGVQYEK
jgi:DNA modification methylase